MISVQEAAKELSLKPDAVRGLLAAGYLKGQKVDRVWQISLESLHALQQSLRGKATVRSLSPAQEHQLAASGRCPVCGSPFRGVAGGSSWSVEFLECAGCEFSIHESFISGRRAELHRGIQEHLDRLNDRVTEGKRAENCLARRASL